MVYQNYKCIFIHIPKSAGRSLTNALGGQGDIKELFWHESLYEHKNILDKNIYQSYYKFAFVRNPWDRILSAFYWYKGGGVQNKFDQETGKLLPWTFKKFIKNYDQFISDHDNKLSPHFLPQMEIICNPKEFDFIGRFENLQDDFSTICNRIGISRPVIPHSNKSNHNPYWKYYNPKTIDIVADIFKEDIKAFSYEFK